MNKKLTKIVGITLGLTMAVGASTSVAITSKNSASRVEAGVQETNPNWEEVTALNQLNASDVFAIATNDGAKYWDGTFDGGHLQTSAFTSSTPANNADGVVKLVNVSGNTWKVQLVSDDKFLIATAAKSGSGTTNASDSYGWTFSYSSGFNATYQETGKNAYLRSYNNASFRTYASTSNGATFKIFKYQVSTKTLSSIAVSDNSGKTWRDGDTVLPSNLQVVATYSDASTKTITDGTGVTITNGATLSQGSNTLNVTYSDVYGTANGSISISAGAAVSLSGITVTTAPTKTVYDEGESFDPAGMVVTATYSDSSTENVTSNCTFSPSILTEDVSSVTISYAGKTTTQTVTVNSVDEVTFTAGTDVGTSSGQNDDTITKSGISMHCTSMHDTGDSYRFYKDSTLTFTSLIGNISSIEFTGNDGSNKISNISTTVATGTVTVDSSANTASWSGNASTVSFTLNAQGRANKIVITLAPTEPALILDKNSVDLKTNQTSGVTVEATVFNVDTPTYNWTADNDNVTLVNASSNVVTIKPSAVGDSVVTLTVGGVTPNLIAIVNVAISEPEPGETSETAFTVAQATNHIDEVIDGGTSTGDDGNSYYATGIVCRLYSNSVNGNGQISYYISDDGTTSGTQLEAYNGKGLNGESFTDISDIEVGDIVIIYGRLKKFNTTYEFDSNNYLVSQIKAPKVTSIVLTPSTITLEPEAVGDIDDLFTNIVINQEVGSTKTVNDIVWTSDDDDVFFTENGSYLAGQTHRTSTTIYATIGGIKYGSATINIIDSSVPVVPFDNPVEWVLVDDISTLTAGDQVILVGTKSDVTYAAGTYSSGNNVPADTEHTLTVSTNKITGVVDTMIYTLEAGTEEGSVAFKDSSDNYLYAASSGYNYMKTKTTIDDNASFVLNSDGTVVAQGSNTRNYMRYNNTGANNLFSCYASNSDTGELVTFYKHTGGAGVIDLTSASSTASLHGEELEPGVASSVSIEFGAKVSIAQWEAVENVADVTDYGVLLFRTRKALSSDKPVQDAIDLGKTPTKISKGSGEVPSDPEDGYYSFTVTVNISSTSNYDIVFCAAPFIEVNGTIYILDEVQYSVKTLAEYYIDHNIPSELSDDALIALAL